MERPPGRRTCLYDAEQLDAVVERMALQAAVLLHGCERIAVIGLLRRGAPLAERITTLMVERHGMAPPTVFFLQLLTLSGIKSACRQPSPEFLPTLISGPALVRTLRSP